MPFTNNESHLSTVNENIYSQELEQHDVRNRTYPWGIDPAVYLEEAQQQLCMNKFLTLRESLTTMAQSSSSLNKEQKHNDIYEITNILENLKTMRAVLLALDQSDTDSATRFGKEIAAIITDLLSRVVHQIGQTNIHTPTLESLIAYIRSLMHTRSEHMRQTIPGPLLMAWYELSNLMSSMQHEPELRITNKKARQLIDIALDTAAWAYRHITTERLSNEQIGFKDRSSMAYTYE
ncbi:unnamed protein product [Rotaria sp. Silwood2]|nr:unnamed protein product [Rotaria sp. Silwood2]CAF2872780.1 unnamed protein product [Rotaria sp. Silwood2]CAF4250979.1 unnamed protein product [Rotaria sp. Silwood2]CAF4679099.1 unnamed protein product [Rotaria sp. Silwood2]